ncbi:uncharacterized protein LOC133324771 [Musca vetustissima]|uniref:uncharacterized protein LOC133324771 n=1 Tax=Musca vetustissima TaxID=27455 RepID=UPI002AB7C27A|nr:uncharacterized protein LOC133324771 [Musca vetustissima]
MLMVLILSIPITDITQLFSFNLSLGAVHPARRPFNPRQSLIQARETSTCEGRQSPGPICESCDLLATCVKHSTGWVNIPVETCDTQNGFYCNSVLGKCSNETGPCHPISAEGNFPCTSHGVFPDPYDCQKYHMCYFVGPTLVSASVNCGGYKAFNPATGQCSLTLQHSVCQQQQFVCDNAGDAHAWPMSPNIFYICKASTNQDERILYPSLYRCDDGEVFDGYNCRSVAPGEQMPPSLEIVNKPVDPALTPAPSNPGQDVIKPKVCSEIGLFADTEDCRRYYYCSAISGSLRQMECPAGTVFNEALSSCTLGEC